MFHNSMVQSTRGPRWTKPPTSKKLDHSRIRMFKNVVILDLPWWFGSLVEDLFIFLESRHLGHVKLVTAGR